jgi:universal stress protein E
VNRICNILVIVNPLAKEQPAIAKAAILAKCFGASVELLICDTKDLHDAPAARRLPEISNALLIDNLDAWLDQLATPMRDAGIDVSTEVISGDPLHEMIVSWLRDSPADLIVKDTHHHSFATRVFTTHTDWHLIRTCPVPLLLTKPRAWAESPVLVAAIDPGHRNDPSAILDHRILDMTVGFGKALHGEIHAMHTYVPATIALAALGGVQPVIRVSAEALAAERDLQHSHLKAITDEFDIEDAQLHIAAASAWEYLPRMAAECHADIVFMGTVSRSNLERLIIGSTAERMLEPLQCDVLLVKSTHFAHDLPF